MTALFFERLLKAYMLAALLFTMPWLPTSVAEDSATLSQLRSGVKNLDMPKMNFEGLRGRRSKLRLSRKLLQYDDYDYEDTGPPVPPGCSSLDDKSLKCQQAKKAWDHQTVVGICAFVGAYIGAVIIVLLIWWLCSSRRKAKQQARPAPSTSAAPSQELSSASVVAGMIRQAINQGNPNAIALAILRQLSGQPATLWPENYMYWADATKYGTALAGSSVIFVYYTPVLTHDAADDLCQIIRGMRDQAQKDIGNSFPLKQRSIIYGAVAGQELSNDPSDIQQLLDKCRRHGISIWVPSGCWQEGSMDAAHADLHAPEVSSNRNALWSAYQ